MLQKTTLFLTLFLLGTVQSSGQSSFFTPAEKPNKARLIGVSSTAAVGWSSSLIALQYVWYSQFEKKPFHFFDDSHEWNQMDKAGHLLCGYLLTSTTSELYSWSGLNRKQSAWIGGLFGFGYLTSFELLDGTNAAWGFSWSDMAFNALGSTSAGLRHYYDIPDAFSMKFSYQHTDLAAYRPNVLGNSFGSRMLKDYNGQTYWVSFNPFNWNKKNASRVPKWLALSVGYGTQNQLYGNGDTFVSLNENETVSFTPYRQLFLSLDVNFEAIETDKDWLKVILKGLNIFKVPFPALEYSQGGVKFRPLYF